MLSDRLAEVSAANRRELLNWSLGIWSAVSQYDMLWSRGPRPPVPAWLVCVIAIMLLQRIGGVTAVIFGARTMYLCTASLLGLNLRYFLRR